VIVEDWLKASLRKINVYASGETPTPENLADALSAGQTMLRSWAAERINVFASTKETVTLTPGTFLYTWGTGGSINSDRPHQVLGASITDSGGVTHGVDLISEGRYRSITVKATISRPYALFFHPAFPLANVYLYPVPDTAETLSLDSLKPFTETSSFTDLTDVLSFPAQYEEALIYNLAIRLAPEFGKVISAEIAAIASSSYNRIVTLNSANQVEPAVIVLPASTPYGARYSINSDSYH
jgi:hypothetical protein